MRFVDTNILLYAVSTSVDERAKHDTAIAILGEDDLVLSVQVLQEFYVQATRASRSDPLSHEQAVSLIEAWQRYPVQDVTTEVLMRALGTRQRWQLSYWDAAIVESARAMGCATLLSEDLQDGVNFDGVRVENPFRASLSSH